MWVTQTYLGNVEPDAKLFVYYFFEDDNSDQKKFTQRVQRELENLGDVYGDQVSLLMPNPRYANKIESEVRQFNWESWFSIGETGLPGLFISPKPISTLDPKDDGCVYIPFKKQDAKNVAEVIHQVRGIADNTLNWDFANQYQSEPYSLGRRFADALELKPGIWGFKIDLRKLFEKH